MISERIRRENRRIMQEILRLVDILDNRTVIICAVLGKMWIDYNSGGELGLMTEHDDENE